VNVCIAYDCLYPYTIGGAERWYRNLVGALVEAGHDVTYLTRRQWADNERPTIPGLRVVVVSRPDALYDSAGRRLVGPPVRFGFGVLRHLLANRRRYDAVHLCSFPFFSLIGARVALARTPTALSVDWFEVWSRKYWQQYLGRLGGSVGWLVQRLCVRLTPHAYVYSDMHARRLAEEGISRLPVRLAGLYQPEGGARSFREAAKEPLVVFAGRHIPEKRAEVVPRAVASARSSVPGLRGLVLGDGPRRAAVLDAIDGARAEDFVEAPGFVPSDEVAAALNRATCHLLPSSREGYGLVVIEAASEGTPTVTVAGEDNAAAELIEEGVNGFVAASVEALPHALVAVHRAGESLRASTRRWFMREADQLSASRSAQTIVAQMNQRSPSR
jgi:glycosyltransferase involved in cell wall biosynthesis